MYVRCMRVEKVQICLNLRVWLGLAGLVCCAAPDGLTWRGECLTWRCRIHWGGVRSPVMTMGGGCDGWAWCCVCVSEGLASQSCVMCLVTAQAAPRSKRFRRGEISQVMVMEAGGFWSSGLGGRVVGLSCLRVALATTSWWLVTGVSTTTAFSGKCRVPAGWACSSSRFLSSLGYGVGVR